MLHFGPISSVFDLSTFVFMWWGLHANRPELQTLFQSGWFLVGLMTQMLVVHVVRTRRLPFVQSHASAVLITMTGLMSMIGLALTQGPGPAPSSSPHCRQAISHSWGLCCWPTCCWHKA